MSTSRAKTPKLILGNNAEWLGGSFALRPPEIAAHRHCIGISGSGKSRLLASMFVQLLNQGIAAAVVDPHSDLVLDILGILLDTGYFDQPGAFEKLLYVDFSNKNLFVPFNILRAPYPPHTIARNVVEVCKRVWTALADGAAPNFENVTLASVLVLVENQLPFTCMPKLLTDKEYREGLLANVTDPYAIDFFHDRYDAWGKGASMLIESSLRRLYLSTFVPTLRYSLGQAGNILDFRKLMDDGVSVLFNLGGLDEETTRFLGCLITVGYETAALSRADIPQEKRTEYHLIIDEFSQFVAGSEEALSRILSLARKFNLHLTMVHQTWHQLTQKLRGALQNCQEISFRLGRADALISAGMFADFDPYLIKHEVRDPAAADRTHPVFMSHHEAVESWAHQLESLKPRHAYVKVGARTAKIKTLNVPSMKSDPARLQQIVDRYAEKLLVPRERIGNLNAASGSIDFKAEPAAQRRVRVS